MSSVELKVLRRRLSQKKWESLKPRLATAMSISLINLMLGTSSALLKETNLEEGADTFDMSAAL